MTARARRPRIIRVCRSCGVEYRTSSGTTLCHSCYHESRKHPCADCGAPIDQRAKVCRPCWGAAHGGSAAPAWKGGKTRHRVQGYVLVKTPDHPRANSQGYVREHTLVMESVLGRYLLPGENVHHINGVRDDNRAENLELWTIEQPSGQRAVDLLVWARRIIATYAPDEALLGLPTIPTCEREATS